MNIENKLKQLLNTSVNLNNQILELLTEIKNNNYQKFDYLNNISIIDLIKSEDWPEAVKSELVINPSDLNEKKERGYNIIHNYVEEDLKDLNFLDYGCGDGYTIDTALKSGAKNAIGYDIKHHESWNNENFTTNFEEIKNNEKYDVVLLFDVLDHLINENPEDVLKNINSIMKKNGRLYVRFHPYTSRSATHCYHKLNKAYAHLVLSDNELLQFLNNDDFIQNNGPTRPIKTYEEYIRNSGFIINERIEITEKPEEFFKSEKISNLIKNKIGFNDFPEFQMSINFIDYKLIKK